MKNIVQRLTGEIQPSPSNIFLPILHAEFAGEVLCVFPAGFCSSRVHRAIHERSTKSVDSHTA